MLGRCLVECSRVYVEYTSRESQGMFVVVERLEARASASCREKAGFGRPEELQKGSQSRE